VDLLAVRGRRVWLGYNDAMADNDSPFRVIWRASLVGINLVTTTFVGFVIGYYLDKWLGTRPWLMVVFTLLGIVAGFRDLFRIARESSRQNRQDDKIQ
jgi:ATP synthase protein I